MAYESLRAFVAALEAAGELRRIGVEVDPVLEITEIADREMKSPGGGKALLFEKCKGGRYPLLINAYGSTRRMAMVLGVSDVEEIARELESLLKAKPPTSFKEAVAMLGAALELRHAKPRAATAASTNELSGLDELPIQKCWPGDAGRFITLPLVITRDPDTGARNVGMYRMQVINERTSFMHWQMHKTGARHWRRHCELKRRMPVTVALGGDPVYAFCASAPLPDGVDEFQFAGYLRRKPVELARCKTNELEAPADCDFVLEGYVDPNEPPEMEGPFGDHTGYYSAPEPYPKFHVERIAARPDAIYPSTIVGIPPMEDFYMGTASVRIFLPVIKLLLPEIVDIALPPEGVFHNLVVVSIRKQFPYHAMKVMHALWGMGQMMFTKIIVVVDADVNVHDMREVLFRLCANIDPQRDLVFSKGPADVLDHATPVVGFGSKLGVDATHKLPGEKDCRPWPPIVRMDPAVKRRVEELLQSLG
ncbi:MAG: menaquinone biosynthesis decarboxylase [Verrucomicrobiae bacterium]|nr:menaquinone biosynthesis decarboxylase [Verrucomicrobiae bacterium]